MKKILIDVDGVLRDIVNPIVNYVNEIFGKEYTETDVTDWDIGKALSIPEYFDWYLYFIKNDIKGIFYHSFPYKDAIINYHRLSKNNSMNICTAQFPQNQINTIHWLEKYTFKYDSLHFTNSKYNIMADIFIDDNLLNVIKYRSFNEKSEIFLIDRPWNQQPENPGFYKRVSSLKDIII